MLRQRFQLVSGRIHLLGTERTQELDLVPKIFDALSPGMEILGRHTVPHDSIDAPALPVAVLNPWRNRFPSVARQFEVLQLRGNAAQRSFDPCRAFLLFE